MKAKAAVFFTIVETTRKYKLPMERGEQFGKIVIRIADA